MTQFSDYLFIGSMILLVGTLIFKGLGVQEVSRYDVNNNSIPSGSITDLQLMQSHSEIIKKQNSFLDNIIRSYLVWTAIVGIIIAIIIT